VKLETTQINYYKIL